MRADQGGSSVWYGIGCNLGPWLACPSWTIVHVVLGPTINIQRGPLGGRGFESISEDPVLSGLAAASLIAGIQANGVIACLKHFVCNDQEHERNRVDVRITQRALREIYLLPFMLAIKGGKPGAMMSSYNKINGLHVSESKELLTDVLRTEWGWTGLIMSDWWVSHELLDSCANLLGSARTPLQQPSTRGWIWRCLDLHGSGGTRWAMLSPQTKSESMSSMNA